MRLARMAATATALTLVAAASTTAPVHAAVSGVGTSAASTSLLDVQVGSLLGVNILTDTARATIDPSVATPEAFSRLTAATITSSVLPAPLNNVSVPVLESRSPGGAPSVSGPAINLANPVSGVSVPAAILGGAVAPATLTSAVDGTGAHTTLTAALSNLNLVGGLVNVQAVSSLLGANARPDAADGSRTVKADAISLVDLGALLNGLGIPLGNLPISTVSGILASLGVPVAGVPSSVTLDAFVTELNDTIDALQVQLADPAATVVGAIPSGILGGLGLPIPPTGAAVPTIQGVIDTVQSTVNSALSTAMAALDGLTLLSADGVEVGTVSKAADTVANSAADIVAKIGSIKVGGVTLPGVDLASTTATINALVSDVNSRLSSALGTISPDLANLVSISMFDKDPLSGVTSAAGYTKSLAGITALTTKIVPPANLASIVTGLTSAGGIAAALTGATPAGVVPQLDGVMTTLNGLLGSAVQSLSSGATLKLASVSSGASFTTPVSGSGGALPRTGGTAQVALFGFGLAIATLATRRWVTAHRAM